MKFNAFQVSEIADKQFQSAVIERDTDELPEGDVLIEVQYSSLNYKDALSASGNRGVTREYPHTPGIDAAGIIKQSDDAALPEGAKVIVTGYDLGMNTPGGFAEYIRVPAQWVVPCPDAMEPEQSMRLGTAGLTAALCIEKLLQAGVGKDDGPVLVTGATGGVGIIAVNILSQLGFEVAASTGKAESHEVLKRLGASQIVDRNELSEANSRPMLKEQWAGAVDVVGGDTLFNVVKSLRYGGSVAACGLVQSPMFQASVLPFILRGVNLLGVDSVELPLEHKARMWEQLATAWQPQGLESVCQEITLSGLQAALDTLLRGGATGRYVLKL